MCPECLEQRTRSFVSCVETLNTRKEAAYLNWSDHEIYARLLAMMTMRGMGEDLAEAILESAYDSGFTAGSLHGR